MSYNRGGNSWSLSHCEGNGNGGNYGGGRMQQQQQQSCGRPNNNGCGAPAGNGCGAGAGKCKPCFVDMAPITVQVPWENGGDCGISPVQGLPQNTPVKYFALKWEEIFNGTNGVRVQVTQNGGPGHLQGQGCLEPKVYFQPVDNYTGPTTTMRMTQGRGPC